MEIIIRILAALGIVFATGLIIGILFGLYWAEREKNEKHKRFNKNKRIR